MFEFGITEAFSTVYRDDDTVRTWVENASVTQSSNQATSTKAESTVLFERREHRFPDEIQSCPRKQFAVILAADAQHDFSGYRAVFDCLLCLCCFCQRQRLPYLRFDIAFCQ